MRSRRWLGASLAKSIMIVTTLAKSVAMMMLIERAVSRLIASGKMLELDSIRWSSCPVSGMQKAR